MTVRPEHAGCEAKALSYRRKRAHIAQVMLNDANLCSGKQ